MQASSEGPENDQLEILPVEHAPEYVIGLPMYVAVTIRAGPDVEFYRLVFGNPVNLRTCLGVDATGPSKAIHIHPRPVVDATVGRKGQSLLSGESRRMLLDVSPLFHDAGEGEYSVRFTYAAPEAVAEAGAVKLRLRRPTAAEEALVRRVAPDRPKFATWGEWCLTTPEQPIAGGDLKDARALAFALALRYLIHGDQPLSGIDPRILDGLLGFYEPERDLMQAELYQERGDAAAVERLTRGVREKTPGMEWWIEGVERGAGFLRSLSKRPARGK